MPHDLAVSDERLSVTDPNLLTIDADSGQKESLPMLHDLDFGIRFD